MAWREAARQPSRSRAAAALPHAGIVNRDIKTENVIPARSKGQRTTPVAKT